MLFRRATADDCDLYFKWANDEKVRENAFNSEPIVYEKHVKWFSNKLSSKGSFLYVCYEQEQPIGQIRVDFEYGIGVIDFSIDKQYRGEGYGTKMLEQIANRLAMDGIRKAKLIGKVKNGNLPSQKAFEKAGYEAVCGEEYIEYFKTIG